MRFDVTYRNLSANTEFTYTYSVNKISELDRFNSRVCWADHMIVTSTVKQGHKKIGHKIVANRNSFTAYGSREGSSKWYSKGYAKYMASREARMLTCIVEFMYFDKYGLQSDMMQFWGLTQDELLHEVLTQITENSEYFAIKYYN